MGKKILIVSDEYPPFHGGIARVASAIATGMCDRGHHVTVFTDGSRRTEARKAAMNGPVIVEHYKPAGSIAGKFHRMTAVPWALGRLAAKEHFDHILIADSSYSAILPLLHTVSRFRFDTMLYGSELLSYFSSSIKRRMFGAALSRADKLFSITKFVDDELFAGYGMRSEVLYLGIEQDFITQPRNEQVCNTLRSRYGFTKDDYVVGTVSRLDFRKGNDVVINAVKILADRYPALRYFIGGIGGELEKLKALVRDSGIENRVVFGGRIADAELVAHYDMFDLYAMPNRILKGFSVEGFGISFVEASARGVASIGVDNGGVGEAIEDGVSGILLADAEPELVAGAIDEILSEKRVFAEDALREHAKRFTWDTCVDGLLQSYEDR